MTLDQLSIGDSFVISHLTANGEIRKRLVDMGFISGATGKLLRRAMLGGPLDLRIGAYRIALRSTEAQQIVVSHSDA